MSLPPGQLWTQLWKPGSPFPLTQLLKYGHIIHGEVVEVHEKSLKLKDQEKPIPFDYLVIASGFGNTFPSLVPIPQVKEVHEAFQATTKAIEEASVYHPLTNPGWSNNTLDLWLE